GKQVLLVERAAFPREKPCSEYLGPEAVRLLDRLGVVQDLEAAGANPLAGTTVIASGGSRLTGLFALAGHQPFRATGLSVARRILDARLATAAAENGATVIERTTLEELLYQEGGVSGAVLRDAAGVRRAVHARLTVGADGLRSIVARRIGRRHHGRPSRIAFVGHFEGVAGLEHTAEMHVGTRGYVGLNAIGNGVTNVALVVPRALAATARGRRESFFHDALATYAGVAHRVDARRAVGEIMVTGPFAATSSRVIAPGALLVGDAADFFDPFTGEGIFSALLGAELAAATALDALAVPGAITLERLAGYRTARRRAFSGKWAVERLLGYGMLLPALFDHAVARLARRGLAHTLIGVTGDFVPAREVLNPSFLARMIF
ncbi:MAG: FAD-dependent monooxygenase, partial [Gemmatimonadota bacterium]